MARLLVHVEGETEEMFVKEVLHRHLVANGYESVSARIIGNARLRNRRGGIRAWSAVKKDIVRHLSADRSCIATTMVDFYGMPRSGAGAWPGRAQAAAQPMQDRAATVESALLAEVSREMGPDFAQDRFVPFVVLHEFEGLLFSDCQAFSRAIERPDLAGAFQAIRDQFDTPEDINDSPVTAPSKRVEALMPSYEKPLFGNLAALEIGLDRMRESCPHFRTWLATLGARAL